MLELPVRIMLVAIRVFQAWKWGIVVVPCLLAVLYWRHLRRRNGYFARMGIPTPSGCSLFLGHLPELYANRKNHEKLLEWQKALGPTFGIQEGGHHVLVTTDPAIVQQVLVQKFPLFHARKSRPWFAVRQENNDKLNLFLTQGNQWKRHRALVAAAFTSGKIKALEPLVDQVCAELADFMEDRVTDEDGNVLDIKALAKKATFAFIARSTLGVHQEIGQETSLLEQMEHVFESRNTFDSYLNKFFAGTYDFLPYTSWLFRLSFLPQIGGLIALRKNFKKIIETREQEKSEEKAKRHPDILDFLMAAEGNAEDIDDANKELFDQKLVKKLTREELISNAIMLVVAGTETISVTLALTLFELARHQQWQQEIVEEIDQVLGSELPTFVQTQKLQKLDRFVREVHRHYPVGAPVMARRAMAHTEVTDSHGHAFPVERGTAVHVNVCALHFDETLWGPTATRFDPDRFLDAKVLKNSANMLSFGAGPRVCPGMRLANYEVKIAVVHLLRRFRFDTTNNDNIELEYKSILEPKNICLRVSKRCT